ncbi:MAG: glutamate 5-kinase [Planctomycetaceae bacterium]|jgi:glutamate 5-kinase|nr:glutamate 5-kinase [Planctomycetaceae bacterium]
MPSILRDEILKTSEVIVVKVGTNVLTHADGLLNERRIDRLTGDLRQMIAEKHRIVLVSSGAVGAGMGLLRLTERPAELAELQAVAAVGQGKLIETYQQFLQPYGILAAQVLLTADDLSNRKLYLNARNAVRSILDFGALPIINENDTVSTDELHTTFGDNDRLAALVANLFENPLLILLTDVDGLFDRDPAEAEAKLIPLVERWSPDLQKMVADKHSKRSKGGMSSKLKAAKMITESGGSVIIANGDKPESLNSIFTGEETGTLFLPHNTVLSARQRWLGFAVRTEGRLTVDDGAIQAMRQGKSLLSIGVLDAAGTFNKGGIVSVVNGSGDEVARGLTNYGIKDVLLIQGKRTNELYKVLGRTPYSEIIHHNNLIFINGNE